MRIALIIERLEPSRGGRETSTLQVAAALARAGQDVTVVCQRGVGGPGVRLVELGSGGLTRYARLRRFVQTVQKHLADESYDIAHAMLPIDGVDVYQPRGGTMPAQQDASYRRRGALGRLAVAWSAPLNRCRNYAADIERRLAGDSRVTCLAVSQMVAREFERHYDRRDGVHVVFNGVDVPPADSPQRADWRQKLRFSMDVGSRDMVFLTIATNFELKGVSQAISAFARWYHADAARRNARLVVVGREHTEGYHRQAQMREVGAQVTFIGPTDDVFPWYAAADAFMLLSWYDPCSRCVLEAARWGVPSITTAFNGASEAVAAGGGLVVGSPRDTRAIVAAMDELADPQRRAAHGEACRKIAGDLSVDRHVEKLMEAYAQIAATRTR